MPRRFARSCLGALALSLITLSLGSNCAAGQTTTVVASQINPGGARAPGSCVTIAILSDAAGSFRCGDVVWAHGMPAATTMGITQQPTWLYSFQQAITTFAIGANVATTASGINQLQVVTRFWQGAPGSSVLDSVTETTPWSSGWSTGAPRRVTLSDQRSPLVSGAYAYTVVATFVDSTTATVLATASDTGTIGVINRATSPYGPGLWILNVEQLSFQTPDTSQRFWVGGDGSTRLYTAVASGVWVVTPAVDRPDSLVAIGGGYRRHLPNGAYVQFDTYGRQVATRNTQGQVTQYYPNGSGSLDSLVLAVPSGSSAHAAYTFAYTSGGGGAVTTTVTPPSAGSARTAKAVWGGTADYAFDFYDPDSPYVNRELRLNMDLSINSTYNTWGNGVFYVGQGGSAIDKTIASRSVSGLPTIVQRFCPAEFVSLTSCQSGWTGATAGVPVDTGSVRTYYLGPRDSVESNTMGDTLSIHVNAFGAATKIIDADSGVTTIQYSDTFPLLPVKTVGPTGTTTQTAYNGRGLPDSTWVVSPYGGANAVTRYTWDAAFNVPTNTVDPAGGIDSLRYDGSGNLLWEQDGRGSVSQVRYAYTADNQVDSVQPPGNSSSQMAVYTYDPFGNLATSTTPMGFVTQHYADAIGRDTLVLTPTDSAQTSSLRTVHRIAYDVMGRVTQTTDTGATVKYFILDTVTAWSNVLRIKTTYDGMGRPTVVARRDLTGVLQDSETATYDEAGRRMVSNGGSAGRHGYVYDLAGNLVADSTPRGFVLTRGYDAANRLIWKVTPGDSIAQTSIPNNTGNGCWCGTIPNPYFGAVVIPRDSAIFRYDAAGRLDTAANYAAVITRTYYPGGSVKTDSTAVLPYVPGGTTTRYGILDTVYDLDGRRNEFKVPSVLDPCPGPPCVEWRVYNRQTGTLDSVGTTTHWGFIWHVDAAGRDTFVDWGGGSTAHWTYDADGRMVTRNETGSVVTHSDTLRYDAVGHVIERKTHSSSWTGHTGENLTVTSYYSGLGAVIATQTNRSAMSQPNLLEEWGAVDATGVATTYSRNRGNAIGPAPSATQPVTAWRYAGGNNQFYISGTFDSIPGWTISTYMDSVNFDASGNGTRAEQTSYLVDTLSGYPIDSASEVYRWYGADEKLRAVMTFGIDTIPGGWSTYNEYRYDALGRKVFARSRVLPKADSLASQGAVSAAQRFIWDGDQLLGEVRVPGDSAAEATDALDTDAQALGSGPYYGIVEYTQRTALDMPIAMDLNDTLPLALHTDGAGYFDVATTPTAAACCTTIPFPAATALAYHAQPVTAALPGWGGSLVVGWQDESGLIYMRNRWYDPVTQQFTQPDPTGLAGGANFYGYAGGDPINESDPSGLCPCYDGAFLFAGNMLAPAQGPLEFLGSLVSGLPVGGFTAIEGIGAEALALGETLESGAGSGLLTAASMIQDVAAELGSDVEPMAGSVPGFKTSVQVTRRRVVEARIKSTGAMRVTINGMGAFTDGGDLSDDLSLTHLQGLTTNELINLVKTAIAILK